ncbi:MAG: DUF4860 domain-containing protein [Lachnospiraceae bacterium]|nr:DUF4860 domain-containing protein [Lachnospiraceae bacterium]
MNFRKREKSIVDLLFILTLFAVFMLCSMFIVLFGAKIYKKVVSDSEINYSARTTQAYITEKIRQHDSTGGVDVIYEGEKPVLRLYENYDGAIYYTYLYEDDGYLKEITSPERYEPSYPNGQRILPINSFNADKISSSLIKFNITDCYDKKYEFYSTIYSGTH